ncbi:MAG: FKBP-type peptidyl-prolyl cis-trans isomerase [Proteobacteria bacterium]|nr:FKBP-type peptidyl-prolyl cis-trans isomerase [Pseudomonadota bacterium]MBU1389904.1 FKBP-type peptidyl-prolyl cis-trans isomerase [Pseudomonadota bacterium]MBU1543913.1 FKBP-type peptidyl-prolyl cis-trans isomerase [Pseudomonadota bacterium]MBU2429648.1 FKBP-type peptidyl-prolyl cis-trans isomerase [Pseudomonadota bacterium]MBU2482191.1 FKBP-type peptidyl-prolyl cis-trans isomerase [Pseudomonadota bacterium]
MNSFKHHLIQGGFLLIVVLIFFSCTAVKKAPVATDKNDPQATAIRLKIAEAVAEAKRTGKTSIDVFLDEEPGIVQAGDLVKIHYSARLTDERLSVDLPGFSGEKVSLLVVAGKPTYIPGLDRAGFGMKVHEKKQVTIPPENAFGIHSEKKTQNFACIRQIPVMIQLDKETYQKQFNTVPAQGDTVQLNPYFESEVMSVSGQNVILKNNARNGYTETAPFGKTTLSIEDDIIRIRLTPQIGAPFISGENQGIIVSADENSFIVDFNHPLAGQQIMLDMEVLSITKASEYLKLNIDWIDDHDAGLDVARKENKNKILVLYADWCQWCEKLLNETFTDPRIRIHKDDFVWVKANSDKDQTLKALYSQEGFPMIVFTDAKGKILWKAEGYKDAETLLAELDRVMNLNTETDN